MLKKIRFWLEASRWYALPMSIFSWLIVYSYALHNDGNFLYGLLALVGICFAHLATNLFDDFCDFNFLQKNVDCNNKLILPNTQRGKCRYLLEEKVRLTDVLKTVSIYCLIAFLIGIFFVYTVGKPVYIFMGIGAGIVLLYSIFSYLRLSELLVAIAFGPLLFLGTYYVMTGHISSEVLILSVPSMIFTTNLLYTDSYLDKNIDLAEGKKTLVSLFKNDSHIFRFQQILLGIGYCSIFLIPVFDICDWEIFFVFLTIPMACDLIESLKEYSENKESIPDRKWYHFPFESWNDIKENRSQPFMFRMYQARNLMIYVATVIVLALWLD